MDKEKYEKAIRKIADIYGLYNQLSVPEWAQENGEVQRLRCMASDIDVGIACLEGLDDWEADELARQATIRKRAVEKRIRDLTEGQP